MTFLENCWLLRCEVVSFVQFSNELRVSSWQQVSGDDLDCGPLRLPRRMERALKERSTSSCLSQVPLIVAGAQQWKQLNTNATDFALLLLPPFMIKNWVERGWTVSVDDVECVWSSSIPHTPAPKHRPSSSNHNKNFRLQSSSL